MVLECGQLWPDVFYIISFLLPWLQFVVLFCFPLRIIKTNKQTVVFLSNESCLEKVITYVIIPSWLRNFSAVSDLPSLWRLPRRQCLAVSAHSCC